MREWNNSTVLTESLSLIKLYLFFPSIATCSYVGIGHLPEAVLPGAGFADQL